MHPLQLDQSRETLDSRHNLIIGVVYTQTVDNGKHFFLVSKLATGVLLLLTLVGAAQHAKQAVKETIAKKEKELMIRAFVCQ